MMRRTRAGRSRVAPAGEMLAGRVPSDCDMPTGIQATSLVPDWPWASAGDEPMTRAELRAGYRLRGRDIRRLETAGLLSVRRTWSGRFRYVATSGQLPERPRRARRTSGRLHPRPRPRWSCSAIALAATGGAGRLLLLILLVLGVVLRPVSWWLLLAAAAALCLAVSPHTPLLAVPAAAGVIKAAAGIAKAIARGRQPAALPPPRPPWWG